MKNFVKVLLLLPSLCLAGSVTINGKDCGNMISQGSISPEGNVFLFTNKECSSGQVPEPPVVIPPPSDTCGGCTDKPWPAIPQARYDIAAGEVHVYRVKTTSAGLIGRVVTNYTTGETSSRLVALSKIPRDFNVLPRCQHQGGEATTIQWQQGGTQGYRCLIEPNTTYYINVKATNCAEGAKCGYTMSAN